MFRALHASYLQVGVSFLSLESFAFLFTGERLVCEFKEQSERQRKRIFSLEKAENPSLESAAKSCQF